MIKLFTFTPVWRRPEVFEICLAGLKRLQNYDPERFDITPFFVVSEPEAAAQVQRAGFDYIYFENRPLGAKKNAGLNYIMRNYDFDYLVEVGSDDIIANGFLDLMEPYYNACLPQITPSNVWFLDVRTGKTAYFETDKVLGLGRSISRPALERFEKHNYQLWVPEKNRGMDTCSWLKLLAEGFKQTLVKLPEPLTLDLKSDVNINTISPFTELATSAGEMAGRFPEGDMILRLIDTGSGKVTEPEQDELDTIFFLKKMRK